MRTDTKAEDSFPITPVTGNALLQPIRSWREMYAEMQLQGIEFDEFWDENVQAGVTYFFRWIGEPRATILVVWVEGALIHVECRRKGDILLSGNESAELVAAVEYAFGKGIGEHERH